MPRCCRALTVPGDLWSTLCDLSNREVGDDPQREDVALIGCEAIEERQEVVARDALQCVRLGLAARDHRGRRLGELDGGRASCRADALVDQRVARDREHPGRETARVPGEIVEVVEDAEEHLAREVFGIAGATKA